MEGKDPLLILHKLNSDFHRSKKEQIDRFLRDQDELNKKFGDCSITAESNTVVDTVDDDDDDNSSDDVESQFNLRLDTFRVRPLSARIGSWSLEEDANKSPNKPFATVKLSNNENAPAPQAQPPVVDHKEYQKYARDRSSSRDRKTSSKPRTRPNGIKDRNKSKDRSVGVEKTQEHKADEHTNENQPQKLLVRRRHRPRTAMGLQIASNDDGTTTTVEPTSPRKESNKPSVALGTGPSSSRRPLRASAPAAPTRQQPTGWETAEEMKRNTFLERQSVVRGGRESPAPNTVGASVAALHHRNRQQELLASGSGGSVSNLTTNTTTDPTSTLRSSLTFGGATPRTGAGGKDPNGWASLTGTPRHTARNQLGAESLLSGNTARGNNNQHQQLGTSNSTSSNNQGAKGLSHRKVGQGGPSEGGAVRTKVSLIKLPRLEGTLPKTMLQSKEHGLVANTPTG